MQSETEDGRTSRFVAGILGRPFGLQGFVKFRSLSGETAHLLPLKQLTLRKDGLEYTAGVEAWRITPTGASGATAAAAAGIVKIAGVDSPEAAKALSGSEIIVPRENAAPLGVNEYYIEDLQGLAVTGTAEGEAAPENDSPKNGNPVNGNSVQLGVISGALLGGRELLLEITRADGAVRLVPFHDRFIGTVSLENRTVELRTPWLLE